jgi:NAD(P)-dependent dehydrogenase (short-subunit alcohol dehydrogenase family)
MGKLDGKIAVITGAARGHAESIAVAFAREGASLSICDIIQTNKLADTTGGKIKAAGGNFICFQTDVSSEDQVTQMVQDTLKHYGKFTYWRMLLESPDQPGISGI